MSSYKTIHLSTYSQPTTNQSIPIPIIHMFLSNINQIMTLCHISHLSHMYYIRNNHACHVIINSQQTSHILTHIAYYITYNHILDSIILSCHIKIDSMSFHLFFVSLDSDLRIKRYVQNCFLTLLSTHYTSN